MLTKTVGKTNLLVMKSMIKKIFIFFGIEVKRNLSKVDFERRVQEELIYEAQRKFGSIYSVINVDKIVDVGSNEGQFVSSCELIFKDVKYYCFEPLKDVFSLLSGKYSVNPKFSLFNLGLGSQEGSISINQNEYSPSSSILEMNEVHKNSFDFAKHNFIQEIQIQKLDSFVDRIQPDQFTLLKIDVQGYELEVINGGGEFIKKVGTIIIEMSFQELYKNQPLFNDIYIKLISLGFRYCGNIEQLYSPVNNQILQADCLFMKMPQ